MPILNMEPPVGGLNARDSLDGLQENEAINLVNWIPDVGYMKSRNGFVDFADTGTGIPIGTLIPFSLTSGNHLLAVSNLQIFDITDPQAPTPLVQRGRRIFDGLVGVRATPEVMISDRVTYAQFKAKGIITQKGNTPFIYDPTLTPPDDLVLGVYTQYIDPDLPAPDPLVVTDLVKPVVFKGRVIYVDAGKKSIWYAQAGSYQGELTEFPLDGVFQKGGAIKLMFTWSKDTGDGMDDMLVIMSTMGETLVYQGDDPDSALGWELIQRYGLPEPIADYGLDRVGSETIIITEDGYINLSEAISEGQISDYANFSSKLTRLLKNDLARYQGNYGWQVEFYAHGSMIVFNVPILEDAQHYQHIFNTRNGSWTTFEGWNANCFVTFQNALLFGGIDGKVYLADTGTSDNGEHIHCASLSAYTRLGDASRTKHMTAMTIIQNHNYPSAFSLDAVADFRRPNLPPLNPPQELRYGTWDISNWDEDYWGIGDGIPSGTKYRRPIQATGNVIAFSVRQSSANQTVFWFSQTYEWTGHGRK